MNILVLGSGGREHALAWKLAQSTKTEQLFIAPGNAGTQNVGTNVDLDILDFQSIADFALKNEIKMLVVGPEAPLVEGVYDFFKAKENLKDIIVIGPSKLGAVLEGSKTFAKEFMFKHNIPTGAYQNFTEIEPALAYVRQQGAPIVIKADGLAAGKGVIVAMTLEEAENAIKDMLAGNAFGDAGHRVVIEEFLEGEEASFIVMVDGKNILAFATSQDHKRAYDSDKGPNTGGMGAYSPAPVVTPEIHQRAMNEVIIPTVEGMAKEGAPYTGFLYAGLMIDNEGTPKVIEYNCRFGDPETQPIMMRLKSDLVELCMMACRGELDKATIDFDPRPAVGVVLAAAGYPGNYPKGDVISGLDKNKATDRKTFHAGTSVKAGEVVTAGGRVLCATALGDNVTQAQRSAYELLKEISWPGVEYRTDIAYRAIEREQH